jgi:hypothetical protein
MHEALSRLDLPTEFSLGCIAVYARDQPTEPAQMLEARGTVRVPSDARLFLDLSQEVCDDLRRIHYAPSLLLSNGVSITQKNVDRTDFGELRGITGLCCLTISLCPVLKVEQLRQLGTLTWLEHLSLSGTELDRQDFSWVRQFPNLKTLNLFAAGADESCLELLFDLSQLQEIDLGRANLSDESVRSLWRLSKLSSVSLADCPIGDASINEVGQSVSLQALKVPSTHISDSGVKHIARELGPGKRLNLLELRSCQITDKSLVYLASMTSLRFVGLLNTKVTREGVEFFKKSLPDCRVLVEQFKL